MLDILQRLRAASGPDRAIDLDIARTLGVTVMKQFDPDCPAEQCTYWHYTEKMGDAASLIPDGTFWIAGWGNTRPDEPMGGCMITMVDETELGRGEAPTVSLAICIAAIEARMALQVSA